MSDGGTGGHVKNINTVFFFEQTDYKSILGLVLKIINTLIIVHGKYLQKIFSKTVMWFLGYYFIYVFSYVVLL